MASSMADAMASSDPWRVCMASSMDDAMVDAMASSINDSIDGPINVELWEDWLGFESNCSILGSFLILPSHKNGMMHAHRQIPRFLYSILGACKVIIR